MQVVVCIECIKKDAELTALKDLLSVSYQTTLNVQLPVPDELKGKSLINSNLNPIQRAHITFRDMRKRYEQNSRNKVLPPLEG